MFGQVPKIFTNIRSYPYSCASLHQQRNNRAVFTRSQPFPEATNRKIFVDLLERGVRPPLDSRIPSLLYELLTECWHSVPTKRPAAFEASPLCCTSASHDHHICKTQPFLVRMR